MTQVDIDAAQQLYPDAETPAWALLNAIMDNRQIGGEERTPRVLPDRLHVHFGKSAEWYDRRVRKSSRVMDPVSCQIEELRLGFEAGQLITPDETSLASQGLLHGDVLRCKPVLASDGWPAEPVHAELEEPG